MLSSVWRQFGGCTSWARTAMASNSVAQLPATTHKFGEWQQTNNSRQKRQSRRHRYYQYAFLINSLTIPSIKHAIGLDELDKNSVVAKIKKVRACIWQRCTPS
jgi:hypothetical protein